MSHISVYNYLIVGRVLLLFGQFVEDFIENVVNTIGSVSNKIADDGFNSKLASRFSLLRTVFSKWQTQFLD